MLAEQTRHVLTVNDFHRMAEGGFFQASDRIELIEGELFDMPPIGPEHNGKTNLLTYHLSAKLNGKAIVSVQNPVVLSPDSELYPDVAVLRWREDFYAQSLATVKDVLLLIEVADTTAKSDRNKKIPLYARHGIPESWLVDLQKRQLEVYREPDVQGYRQILLPRQNEQISPALLPELVFSVSVLWA